MSIKNKKSTYRSLIEGHESISETKEIIGEYVMRFTNEMNHYNYKTYLSWAKRMFEKSVVLINKKIKVRQKRIKSLEIQIAKLRNEVSTLRASTRRVKGGIKAVDDERSYRQKMNRLMNKYSFLDVEYQGDDDVYTTWVWSDKFLDEETSTGYSEDDPYCDNHFCDSYQEAYERCLEYIKEEKQ